VNGRVQRLDAPVHHFRKAGEVGDIEHGVTRLTQRLCRAAGRYQLDPVTNERGGQFGEPRLVADGQKRAADGNKVGHGEGPNWMEKGICGAPYRVICRTSSKAGQSKRGMRLLESCS
jgi:hypothetical protein